MMEEQAGFTPGKRMEEHFLTLQILVERQCRRRGQLWVASVDLMKAFDSLDRVWAVRRLAELGVEDSMLKHSQTGGETTWAGSAGGEFQ